MPVSHASTRFCATRQQEVTEGTTGLCSLVMQPASFGQLVAVSRIQKTIKPLSAVSEAVLLTRIRAEFQEQRHFQARQHDIPSLLLLIISPLAGDVRWLRCGWQGHRVLPGLVPLASSRSLWPAIGGALRPQVTKRVCFLGTSKSFWQPCLFPFKTVNGGPQDKTHPHASAAHR